MPPAGSGRHVFVNGGQGLENSGEPGTYETGWGATDWNNTTDIDPTNGALAHPPYSTWTNTAGSHENLLINYLNWYEAYAFCIWDGGFLPTETEWEYAAAGGSQQREYPWGSAGPGTTNQYAIYYCDQDPGGCVGTTNIAPVGTATLGAARWGQLDMAGEVSEWNVDWYAMYAACSDCAYLTTAVYRVVRGGSFLGAASYLLRAGRDSISPTLAGIGIGFRCARTP